MNLPAIQRLAVIAEAFKNATVGVQFYNEEKDRIAEDLQSVLATLADLTARLSLVEEAAKGGVDASDDHLIVARLKDALHGKGGDASRLLPLVMTPAIEDALGLMIFDTGPMPDLFRLCGTPIPEKAEKEQAFILFWVLGLVMQHGDEWRKFAKTELRAMREKVKGHANPPKEEAK